MIQPMGLWQTLTWTTEQFFRPWTPLSEQEPAEPAPAERAAMFEVKEPEAAPYLARRPGGFEQVLNEIHQFLLPVFFSALIFALLAALALALDAGLDVIIDNLPHIANFNGGSAQFAERILNLLRGTHTLLIGADSLLMCIFVLRLTWSSLRRLIAD